MKRTLIFGLIGLIGGGLGSWSASAAPQQHSLAVGAGVSSPSSTDAFADNPAGLMYNRQVRLMGAASSENKQFNPFNGTARLLYGNGMMGLGLGTHSYKEGTEDRYSLDYGLGVYADSLKSSLGVSVSSRMTKTPSVPGKNHEVNVGMVTNPMGSARIGAGLISVIRGVDYITGGLSADLSSGVSWSVDGSTNRHLTGTTVLPALAFRISDMEFSIGYGYRVDKKAATYLRSGLNTGINLILGPNIEIQAAYNHHSKYYAALVANF